MCDTQQSLAPKKGKVCRAKAFSSSFFMQELRTSKGIVCPKVRSKA
jgi:hypothetical protein